MAETSDNVEELKALIKEKTKENKNLSKKLQKAEEGFIKKHTELSELQSERGRIVQLLKSVFPDKAWDKPLTTREYEALEGMWTRREEDVRNSVQDLTETLNREVMKWKEQCNRKEEDLRARDDTISELKGVENALNQTQAALAESKGEVAVLEKQLETLRLDNASLRSLQDELAKTKASSLLAALDQRPNKVDPVVELDKVQKQLVSALKRIEELENLPTSREHEPPPLSVSPLEEMTQQRNDFERQVRNLKEKLETQRNEFQEHRKKAQKMIMEKEMALDRLKQSQSQESARISLSEEAEPTQQVATLRLRVMEMERLLQGGAKLNLEYLRNVIAKYMEYINAGNHEEARTLANVIYTALEFAPEEVDLIEKAREANGLVRKVSTILSATSPGAGVSHNTLHTAEGRKRARLQPVQSLSLSMSNTYRSAEEEKFEVVALDKPS
jgi:DNA repair exonuclease SbcCD ATPase subunit